MKYLNEERKKQKLSIDDLASKANLPKSTVEKILFGIVKHPRIDTLQAIEKALGIDYPERFEPLKESERIKEIGLSPIEKEMLLIFRDIGKKHGEEIQRNLIVVAQKML